MLQRNATPTRDYLIYREYRANLPVIGGRLDVALNLKGAVSCITQVSLTNGRCGWTPFNSSPEIIYNGLEPANLQLNKEKSLRLLVPRRNIFACVARSLLADDCRCTAASAALWNCGCLKECRVTEWPGISHEVLNLHVTLPEWPEYEHEEPVTMSCAHQITVVNGDTIITTQTGIVSTQAGTQADVLATLVGAIC